jgi:hypothetical protein
MPTLVHLTPEKNVARILRSGIKPTRAGWSCPAGVYCMPILPDFSITYQWLRELKRGGGRFHRTIVGVTFRLRSDEPVWIGHYAQEMAHMELGAAIRLIMRQPDARGYQILVPRRIAVRELRGTQRLPQVVGWRYLPDAHDRWPCICPMCLPKGSYRSASIRARLDPDPKPPTKAALVVQVRAAAAEEEVEKVL